MADEDALFAEFMGEIKSTVVEAEEPKADLAADAAGVEAEGAASDTASVGDVNADTDNDTNKDGADADTNKRKGEVRADVDVV